MSNKKRLKKVEKGFKKGLISGEDLPKLTKNQAQVLGLLDDFLTVKQIARRRKTSHQAVYKILKTLEKKGVYNRLTKKVEKTDVVCNLFDGTTIKVRKNLRLHAEEFNIKIIWKDPRYKNLLAKSNTINIDGNTIRLYQSSIEIYSAQSFYGKSPQAVVSKGIKYWRRFFKILESDLRIILTKPRVQNIKLVKAHLSEVDNELAKDYEDKGDKLEIKAKDGKPWLWIDNSFNFHELETGHPQTYKPDMEKVQDFFNDIRDMKEPATISQILNAVGDLAINNKETAEGLNLAVKTLNRVVERMQ